MTKLLLVTFLSSLAVFIVLLSISAQKSSDSALATKQHQQLGMPDRPPASPPNAGGENQAIGNASTSADEQAVLNVPSAPAIPAPTYDEAVLLAKGFPEVLGTSPSFQFRRGMPSNGRLSVAVNRSTPAGVLRRAISARLVRADMSPSIAVELAEIDSALFTKSPDRALIRQETTGKLGFVSDIPLSNQQQSELSEVARQAIHFSRLATADTRDPKILSPFSGEEYHLVSASATQALYIAKGNPEAQTESQDTIVNSLDTGIRTSGARANRVVITIDERGELLEMQRLVSSRNIGTDPASANGFSVLRSAWRRDVSR